MRKIESISIFDMLKIGVGPSSSHTLGPWRAAGRWIEKLKEKNTFDQVTQINVELYGSLSLTGRGHATDIAIQLGLEGLDPQTFPIDQIPVFIERIKQSNYISFNSEREVQFNPAINIIFNRKFKEFHPNGITFRAQLINGKKTTDTYYSIGGGFVVQQERLRSKIKQEQLKGFPYPVQSGKELLDYCQKENKKISEIVYHNE
ncbi:MAG: serine dehydratase beta chain, partial [Leeuwenhoekiella sp.]